MRRNVIASIMRRSIHNPPLAAHLVVVLRVMN